MRCAALSLNTSGKHFYLLALPASKLVEMTYTAARGQSDDATAVQRVLNRSRIAKIKLFLLEGGQFPASVVLNWVGDQIPAFDGSKLNLPEEADLAQIIDGQHRIQGLESAISENPEISDLQIPVSLYLQLTPRECADIFLSINTEQKPVPKSLVFDLYEIASAYIVDPASVRASDLARLLQEEGAYRGYIKFPGAPRGGKGLALSTVVSAIKPLVSEKGVLDNVGLKELSMQHRFLANFFDYLRSVYGEEWERATNVFRMAAGFTGAVQFIRDTLVPCLNLKKDFRREAIEEVMNLDASSLLTKDLTHKLQGRTAATAVAEALQQSFEPPSNGPQTVKV